MDDKVFWCSIPVASKNKLGSPFRVSDNIVSIGLTLALSHLPLDVAIIPFLLLYWKLGRLVGEGRERERERER